MFFSGWSDLGRVLIVGALAYVGLVALLRVTGKRTLSKMNAFDLVVTVALGSTLATILLSKDVSLAEGMTALTLLVLLQFAAAWTAARSEFFRRLIKADPTLLLYEGRMLEAVLRRERVSPEEVLAAVRTEGQAALEDVRAVVLETDGTFSVITGEGGSALCNVAGTRANHQRRQSMSNKHQDKSEDLRRQGVPDDLQRDPGIGRAKGTDRAGADPDLIDGENTFEGDVKSDTTPNGKVDPRQVGRTNK